MAPVDAPLFPRRETPVSKPGGEPRAWWAWAEAAVVALAVVVFYRAHLNLGGMQSGGDWANLFWPMKEFRARTLAEAGVLPLWCPYVFMGSPLAATMQHAVFYPVDYLFFWPSTSPGAMLGPMNLYLLAHLVFAGLGAWWMARVGLGLRSFGAIAAGVAFPCTAWFWGAQEHVNQIATAAWMPWLAGAAWAWARGDWSLRGFIAAYGAMGAMQLLAGHPQGAFYTHGLAGLVVVGVALGRGNARWIAARLGGLMAAGAMVGVLAAVQLLPAKELADLSYRQFQEHDPGYSLSFSMPPDVLATALVPDLYGNWRDGYSLGAWWDNYLDRRAYNEYGVFVGVPTLLLAAIGVGALWRARRRQLAFGLVAAIALAWLMAMGGNASLGRIWRGEFDEFPQGVSGRAAMIQDVRAEANARPVERGPVAWAREVSLLEVVQMVAPPLRGLRVPARTLVVAALVWALLAGVGVTRVVEWASPRCSSQVVMMVGGGLVVALWLGLAGPSRGEKFQQPKDTAPLLIELANDATLRDGDSMDDRLFRLTLGDLDLIVSERQQSTEQAQALALGGDGVWARWRRWQENNNAVVRVPTVQGYEEGLSPTVRTKDFLFEINRHLRAFEPDTTMLTLLGVARVFSDLPVDDALLPINTRESQPQRPIRDVPTARGAAFWAAAAEGINFDALRGPFERGDAPLGRGRDARIDYGTAPRWNDPWPRLTTDVTNPNEVIVRSEGAVVGDALVAMGYAPGWRVDEAELAWVSAVHARVPASAFREGAARLRYEPASYRLGLWLSALGVLVAVLLLVSIKPTSPRKPSPS